MSHFTTNTRNEPEGSTNLLPGNLRTRSPGSRGAFLTVHVTVSGCYTLPLPQRVSPSPFPGSFSSTPLSLAPQKQCPLTFSPTTLQLFIFLLSLSSLGYAVPRPFSNFRFSFTVAVHFQIPKYHLSAAVPFPEIFFTGLPTVLRAQELAPSPQQ